MRLVFIVILLMTFSAGKAQPAETLLISSENIQKRSLHYKRMSFAPEVLLSEERLLPANSMQLAARIQMMNKPAYIVNAQATGCEIIKTGTAIFSLAYTVSFLGYYLSGVVNEEPRFLIRLFDFDLFNFFLNVFVGLGPGFFSNYIDCSGNPEEINRYDRQSF